MYWKASFKAVFVMCCILTGLQKTPPFEHHKIQGLGWRYLRRTRGCVALSEPGMAIIFKQVLSWLDLSKTSGLRPLWILVDGHWPTGVTQIRKHFQAEKSDKNLFKLYTHAPCSCHLLPFCMLEHVSECSSSIVLPSTWQSDASSQHPGGIRVCRVCSLIKTSWVLSTKRHAVANFPWFGVLKWVFSRWSLNASV